MYAHSIQDKKRFTHFNISEFNFKLCLNYCNPEIREKKDDNLQNQNRNHSYVCHNQIQNKKLLELRNIRWSYVKH